MPHGGDATSPGAFALSSTAEVFAEPARMAMLLALLDGSARPASDLARIARVQPSTASSHLRRLLDHGLVVVRQHGKNRYYALADERVGHALEALAVATPARAPAHPFDSPEKRALRFARTCYGHFAGVLAVRLTDALESHGWTASARGVVTLTPGGRALLGDVGWSASSAVAAGRGKACPDWTERRAHIAGALGVALLDDLVASRWVRAERGARLLRVTPLGEARFREVFGIATSSP